MNQCGILFRHSGVVLEEAITIVDPASGEDLPAWEKENERDKPFLLYRDGGECQWVIVVSGVRGFEEWDPGEGIVNSCFLGDDAGYRSVVAYCFSMENNWKLMRFPRRVVGYKPNLSEFDRKYLITSCEEVPK